MPNDLTIRLEDAATAHYRGIPLMRRTVADLLAAAQTEIVMQRFKREQAEKENAHLKKLLKKSRDWNWIDFDDEDRETAAACTPSLVELDDQITLALKEDQ